MTGLWRISNHRDLVGLGGEKTNGRWHTAKPGRRIVYLAEHPALALVETLVHLNPRLLPSDFQLLKVSVADSVSRASVRPGDLPFDWIEDESLTRSLGDIWLNRADSALLAVPSVPCPEATNYLLNPLHPDIGGVKIEWAKRVIYDKRLLKIAPTQSPETSPKQPSS